MLQARLHFKSRLYCVPVAALRREDVVVGMPRIGTGLTNKEHLSPLVDMYKIGVRFQFSPNHLLHTHKTKEPVTTHKLATSTGRRHHVQLDCHHWYHGSSSKEPQQCESL